MIRAGNARGRQGEGLQDLRLQHRPVSVQAVGRREVLKLFCGAVAATLLPSCGSSDTAERTRVGSTEAAKGGRQTALLADPIYRQHLAGVTHPESPRRYDAIVAALQESGLARALRKVEARAATDQEILACHTRGYIDTAKRDIAAGARSLSTGDTAVTKESMKVALKAVGGILNTVDAVAKGKAKNAFCVVRPPGHHATHDRGMGFCIFNNVALAARYAQRAHKLAKVLIVDWDVHHGNGTQDMFYADGSVFYFSTHQSPWYPGTGKADETGKGKGKGTTLNCPFPAGSGRKEVLGAFKNRLVPAAERFKPNLILISAGFDSRRGDPLGQFTLTDEDFADLTAVMLAVARKHAAGRLISVLEGGYDLPGLASAAVAHVKTLRQA